MDLETFDINGRDNVISLMISDGMNIINPIQLSKIQVQIGSVLLDSETSPQFFDMTVPEVFVLKFGLAGLSPGRYLSIIYGFDTINTHGVKFGEFIINVSDQ